MQMKIGMDHGWEDIGRGKPKYSKKNLSNAILSTTNLTYSNRGSNLDLRGSRRSNNRLSHGTGTKDKKVFSVHFSPISERALLLESFPSFGRLSFVEEDGCGAVVECY
jgi:hypothetical protein